MCGSGQREVWLQASRRWRFEFAALAQHRRRARCSGLAFARGQLQLAVDDRDDVGRGVPVVAVDVQVQRRRTGRPTRPAVLGDITCDSDGKIEQFIDRRDIRRTLPLHPYDGSPYYLGAFLLGAYQEILGDLHNLFGDTNAAHISQDEDGQVVVENIIKGDSVNEVLHYVQFNGRELIDRLQAAVDAAIREGRIDHKQAGAFVHFYEEALNGYTYLEEPDGE